MATAADRQVHPTVKSNPWEGWRDSFFLLPGRIIGRKKKETRRFPRFGLLLSVGLPFKRYYTFLRRFPNLLRFPSLLFFRVALPSPSSSRAVISRALPPFLERGLDMAAAHAVAKGSVVSPGGSRAAPGLLSRRRGAVAARMAPAAMRIGGSWKKTAFLGGRLAVGPRRSRSASRTLVASPVQVNINLISFDSLFFS